MKQVTLTAAIAAMIGGLAYVGNADMIEAEMQQQRYCENVAAWDKSNGDVGWPPYNGREMCE